MSSAATNEMEGKRVFLIACAAAELRTQYATMIQNHFSNTSIYQAQDGSDALFKVENAPPHVMIVDPGLARVSGIDVVRKILNKKNFAVPSIIIMGPAPESEIFIEEVVSGVVQFLPKIDDEAALDAAVAKALNRLSHAKTADYTLHFLAPGDLLFKEGEPAQHVFIVRRGRLRAFKGSVDNPTILGEIAPGEFVGEMAHINHEPRSASVQAIDDCELIEIPSGALDTVLFKRPAWAHALVATLSKRLKNTNQALVGKV